VIDSGYEKTVRYEAIDNLYIKEVGLAIAFNDGEEPVEFQMDKAS
jgi:hypothetical protein